VTGIERQSCDRRRARPAGILCKELPEGDPWITHHLQKPCIIYHSEVITPDKNTDENTVQPLPQNQEPVGIEGYTFDELKNHLLNPREISKTKDQEGRNNLLEEAKKVKEARDGLTEQITSLSGQTALKENEQKQLDEERATLTEEIGKQTRSLAHSLCGKETATQLLSNELNQLNTNLAELTGQFEVLPDLAGMKKAYYESQANSPLSQEEKRQYLTPEFLESLSTDEYTALWKRLNPYFLAHVTRQGIRDHASPQHSAGLNSYSSGLTTICEDQQMLRPPIYIQGLKGRDEESVSQWLGNWVLQAENEEEAKARLKGLLDESSSAAPSYVDKTAVHFTKQFVGDVFYGGETGNEVFFVFPTDVLCSQHTFGYNANEKLPGAQRNLIRPTNETSWNDVFIWPTEKENQGIKINAGIVFLPASTMVSPETGSKYELEKRIKDGNEILAGVEDLQLVNELTAIVEENALEEKFGTCVTKYNSSVDERERINLKEEFSRYLEQMGIPNDTSYSFSSKILGHGWLYLSEWKSQLTSEKLIELARTSNSLWKRPANPIPAKDYWTKYFSDHPEQKPKHIVFYDSSPTTAVNNFIQENGIGRANSSEVDGINLGYDDRVASIYSNRDENDTEIKDPRIWEGYDELKATAMSLIEKRFRNIP
jgi:hypothetical protein